MPMTTHTLRFVFWLLLAVCLEPSGQLPGQAAESRVMLVKPQTQRWVIGLQVNSPGNASGIVGTTTVPMVWPEQTVKIVSTEKSPQVASVRYRTISAGVRQMLVNIARLGPGETAQVVVTFDVTRSLIAPPAQTVDLVIPTEPPATVRRYLGTSPGIEARDERILQLAQEIGANADNEWDRLEAIYDWVRDNVEYEFDEQLRGALAALEAGKGDCEELTSLFVAICRARGVPARSVWIPGHCYPEFYLEDARGQGHWFPCQAAGTRAFGSMPEYRPVLQKGDNFRVPGNSKPQRYVSEMLKAKAVTAPLKVKFARLQVELPEQP